jgi:ATP-dependent helicase HrpA
VASIDPQWVEDAGAHLLVRTYSEPHWDERRGAVMAFERATLFGLPVVARRRIGYGAIDPATSRELFVRNALVEGDWRSHHRFLQRNRETLTQARALEDKLRRRDVVDEEALFAFYDARVPADVVSGRHLDAWWKSARRETPDLLDLSLADLAPGPAGVGGFPDEWRAGDVDLRVTYRFAPGEDDDGVTVHVPLLALQAVPAAALTWQVPGLRHELAVALVKSLPKELRRVFVPAPDTATAVLARITFDERTSFPVALGRELRRLTGVEVPVAAWSPARLPSYLRVHVSVERPDGTVVATGEDLDALRQQLAPALRAEVAAAAPSLHREGLRDWPGGTIPRTVETTRDGARVVGRPALVDEGATVGVRVLATAAEQAAAMRTGTRRLLLLRVPPPARPILDKLSARDKLALARDSDGRAADVVRDAIAAAVDALVDDAGGPAWDAASFASLRSHVAARLVAAATDVLRDVMQVLAVAHEVRTRLAPTPPPALQPSYDDLRAQLADLVPADVATATGVERLPHLVRYLVAMRERLDRLPQDPARDITLMERVHAVEDAWHDALEQLPPSAGVPAALLDVRWMLEELRVSLFAQRLGTAHPVSEKRILHVVHGTAY